MTRLVRGSMRGLALVALALVTLASPAISQSGEPVSETGWWSRRAGATAIDDDGFEVAWGVQGAESVAAVRLAPGAASGTTLLLLEEIGGFSQESAAIDVCLADPDWEPANPGAFADQPDASCAGAVDAGRDAAGGQWVADITTLTAGATGEVSLALVPIAVPIDENLPGLNTTYQVQFGSAAVLADEADEPTTTSTAFDGGFDDGSGDGLDGFDGGDFDAPGTGDGGFDTGDIGGGAVEPTTPEPTTTTAPTTQGTDEFAAAPISGEPDDAAPWIRLVVLVPMSVGFGYGAAILRRFANERLSAARMS